MADNTILIRRTDHRAEEAEGRGFEYNGVALHIRKIGADWIISLLNTGMSTHGIAKTIRGAMELYRVNEGKILEEWKYQPMQRRLKDLQEFNYKENAEQIIDLEYDEKSGRLITGRKQKAGDLI